MYTEKGGLAFIWRETGSGAEILRVYSDMPDVCIPEELDGRKVVSVGAYCFSEINKAGNYSDIEENMPAVNHLCEFCGNNVGSISLPDTIKRIGNNAFYNCRKMVSLEAGASLKETGSDIFMNCTSFTKLHLRHRADTPGGLKHIVRRLCTHLDVYFYDNGKIHAMLVFPEYTESYDEIAPAHIFGRNITGEGFRARQCFDGDIPGFRQYDAIFDKASSEESVNVIYKMALGRLMYPFMLDDIPKCKYEKYIKSNQAVIMGILTEERDIEALYFICQHKYTDAESIGNAAAQASQSGWGEGVASLLEWKYEFTGNARKNRYEF
ncbi:MAG: leucine-rich repeat protein [Lachnospiraceae bacterium]|nr:leucine-rich repeat protein [Lachnospiraceae bacterium]